MDIHVNRFWGWQLSLWPSGRCCLQMFWSGEEKWMEGRKGGEGQSHWTVSSATRLEELRICPATLQKKQKTWQLLIFVLLNFSSKGWKLPTTGFTTKAQKAECYPHAPWHGLWWTLCSSPLGILIRVLPSCHWHDQQCSDLPIHLLNSPFRNLINKPLEIPPLTGWFGRCSTAGVFLWGLTFDCIVKHTLPIFVCSEHFPHL